MHATQVEKEVLGKESTTKDASIVSYPNFVPPKASTSTQHSKNFMQPQNVKYRNETTKREQPVHKPSNVTSIQKENELDPKIIQNYKILQNKCKALERQVSFISQKQKDNDKQNNETCEKLKMYEIENAKLIKYKELLETLQPENEMLKKELLLLKQSKHQSVAQEIYISDNIKKQINTITSMSSTISQHATEPFNFKMLFSTPSNNSPLSKEVVQAKILLQKYLHLPHDEKDTIEGCWHIFRYL